MAQRYRFDRIEVRPSERALLIDGVAAELGSRAFDLLLALIRHGDRVVTKDELLEMVWPGLVVEENNLAAQVSTLRRLLGPKAIATIPARGYQFSLEETATSDTPAPAMPPVAAPKADKSPGHLPRIDRRQVPAKAAPAVLTIGERAAVLGGSPLADAVNASPLSVAVLPFANLTGDANDEYFSDGLADQLLNVLAKITGLRVIARTSSFSFKGKNVDIATIGARLGVAYVVEGSVKKSGNRLRISVQLVKVADSSHLWSEIYDRTLDDIFAVQDDIAQFVLAELRARLMHQSPGKIELRHVETEVAAAAARGRSRNSEANRLYMQARFLMNRHGSDDVLKCIGYLRQALAVDPGYAQGWAALSHALVTAADLGATPVDECAADALKAVERALALEPELVDAHVAMCTYQTMHAWDWHGAVASAQRALKIAPDDVGALKEAARLYYALGRSQEALGHAERAITLDPLNSVCYWYLASCLGVLGRITHAETAIRKALELSPDAPSLHFRLAFFLDRLGRHDEALAEASRERADWGRLFALGILHFRQGNLAEADRALNTLIERCGESACIQIAMNYCVRGDGDRAFEWLERAYVLRDTGLSYVKSGWMTHPIQVDPRWPLFLKKMGFDE